MNLFLKLYAIAFPIFILIDAAWLGLIAKNFYSKHLGYLLKENINFVAAGIFYLLFLIGIIIFVVMPALEKNSWIHALIFGALFGVITYATFDLTNQSMIKDWPIIVTLVDLVWGAFIASSVSVLTFLIAQKISL